MSARSLSNEEMISITAPWVDTQHDAHRLLAARPLTAGILGEIAAAHEDVRSVIAAADRTRLAALQDEQRTVDLRHDRLLRGIHQRLLSEENFASDDEQAEKYREVRQIFTPEGLAITGKSYRHEAGHGQAVAARLELEHRQLLAGLATATGSVLTAAQDYLALAARLGELDHRRRLLDESQRPGRSSNVKARNRWIRALAMVRMASEALGPEDRDLARLILAVDRAIEQAVKRRARSRGNAADEADDASEMADVTAEADAADGRDDADEIREAGAAVEPDAGAEDGDADPAEDAPAIDDPPELAAGAEADAADAAESPAANEARPA